MLLATLVAAAVAGNPCSWTHPGRNPYRGDPAGALQDYAMDAAVRERLAARMRAHQYDEVAEIRRDSITAGDHNYTDLRDMHSGHGSLCHGPVDRRGWPQARVERGLVYCDGALCVIVPTVCNNVSLLTRRPEDDDGPIDIEPSAGNVPKGAADPSGNAFPDGIDVDLPAFDPGFTVVASNGAGGGGAPGSFSQPGAGAPGLLDIGAGYSPHGTSGTGGTGGAGGTGSPGGGGGSPGSPGLVSGVPEPASAAMLLAALGAGLLARWRRKQS